jgi:hypothetical protein
VTDAFRFLLGAGYRQPDKMRVDHWQRGLSLNAALREIELLEQAMQRAVEPSPTRR